MGIGFDTLITNLTVQGAFVELFDTELTHERGGAVVDRIQAPQIFFRHAPHRADRVGEEFSVGVIPNQLGLDFHTADEAVPVHRQPGDLVFGKRQL